MTSIQKLQYIEKKYQLYKYESWQYLRVVYATAIEKQNSQKSNKNIKKSFFKLLKFRLKTIFFGFRNWFRKYDYIVFDVSDNYKNFDNMYLNKFTEGLSKHYDRKKILHIQTLWDNYNVPHKDYYVSDSIFAILSKLLIVFKTKSYVDYDYNIINKELNLNINTDLIYKKLKSRKTIVKFILKLYNPRKIFITSYPFRNYIIAAKELGIPVIEFQHGILNIPGYISKNFNEEYQPDYLLVFGKKDKELLSKNSNYIANTDHIVPVGSYTLDYIFSKNTKKYLYQYKKQFKYIVSISVQDDILHQTLDFIYKVAKNVIDTLFIFIPRSKEIILNKQLSNIVIVKDYSCLEIVKESNFHFTSYSTCAYEVASLGVPNIFWNYKNLSLEYFNEYINARDYNFLINNENELIALLRRNMIFNKNKIMKENEEYFMKNYEKNIKLFLKQF